MYVIVFSMGPVKSPVSKLGVELTDCGYAVLSMRIMTRMGDEVLNKLKEKDAVFTRALHTVGTPCSGVQAYPSWPCDPERHVVIQK